MKVLVCGGRFYNNWRHVDGLLDVLVALHGPITCIVTGACCDPEGNPRGADWWAEKWARKRGVRYVGYPAHFRTMGRAAGPIRNGAMLSEERPDIVIALPGGSGTAGMVKLAEHDGLSKDQTAYDGTVVLRRDTVPPVKPLDLAMLRGNAAAS